MFTGEGRLGREFEGRSGINYILPRDDVLPKAIDVAARIAEKPRQAVISLKRTLSSRAARRSRRRARTRR